MLDELKNILTGLCLLGGTIAVAILLVFGSIYVSQHAWAGWLFAICALLSGAWIVGGLWRHT